MIVKDLFKKARFTLSDLDATRWSDERLIILLNEGLNDIASKTILFVKTGYVILNSQQTTYDFSAFAIKLLRIEYQDKPLPSFSHDEMDNKDSSWQQREGPLLKAYILDKQKEANIKVYPKLTNAENAIINYGGLYGIVTAISYSDLQLVVTDTLGDLGAAEDTDYIKIYYIEKPTEVTSILDEVDLSEIIQEAVTHYISARAFRDNLDVQNRTMGAEELSLYNSQLSTYAVEKAKNFSQAGYTANYNPSGT